MKYLHLVLTASALSTPAFADPLTVYTYDAFANEWGPGPLIAEGFRKYCDGCDVTFQGDTDSGAILSKIRLEGDRTRADVVVGLDQNLIPEARESGLFRAHNVTLPPFTQLIGEWSDDTFVPFDTGILAFCYNKEVVGTPPDSLQALADSDLKILVQDPRSSTPGLLFVNWVETVYGEDADQYWQDLADNIVTITPGWSEAYSLFLDGEADMVLSYTTSPAYHAIEENDDRYAAAHFDNGLPRQTEVAAILKSSDQPEMAEKFLEFMASKEAQAIIPTGNWAYPAFEHGITLPDAFVQPADIDPLPLDPLSDEALDIWARNIQ